ncbi:MAG: GAF domain-containing protein [Polyangiaceae bacterium]|nr:GAF domain-containing protein [Polyangiaceae bacterium]
MSSRRLPPTAIEITPAARSQTRRSDGTSPTLRDRKAITDKALENASHMRGMLTEAADGARSFMEALTTRFELVGRYALAADAAIADLEHRTSAANERITLLSECLTRAEAQVGRLLSLYVATYQLHASLDPERVERAIADIALNLLGAERFALFWRDEADDTGALVCVRAWDDVLGGTLEGSEALAGDPLVVGALAGGALELGPKEGSSVLAAVPLRVEETVVGVLCITKLLGHKAALHADDLELLELLASHAATALCAARIHASTDRKLRTLQGLVDLMRGR